MPFFSWIAVIGAAAALRRRTVVTGIDDSAHRARLIRLGFGDVLPWTTSLDELEARVLRVARLARSVPLTRWIEGLELDLLIRDGKAAGRRVGLFPREFALLWRLAETPGRAVAPETLLREVWQLSFKPETNSLAVHVSRLRAKLRIAGFDGLVETLGDGSYRLAVSSDWALDGESQLALDAPDRLRKEHSQTENADREAGQ